MRIRKGAALFNANDPLTTLYAVRCGSLKTSLNTVEGQGVVRNFWMPGDVLGLDAIATEHHVCDAIALEDSEVCPVPYRRLQTLAREFPVLQQSLNRLMSREIVREHERVLMLCNLTAEQRLASFLVGLSRRFVSRGYSAHGFMLRMSREDMASYLGLRLETVCRSVARLRALRIVSLHGRLVEILDMPSLMALEQGTGDGVHKDSPKALGIGMLVGLERERKKGQNEDHAAAGLRTFAITALLGYVSMLLAGAMPVGVASWPGADALHELPQTCRQGPGSHQRDRPAAGADSGRAEPRSTRTRHGSRRCTDLAAGTAPTVAPFRAAATEQAGTARWPDVADGGAGGASVDTVSLRRALPGTQSTHDLHAGGLADNRRRLGHIAVR